MKGRKIRLPPFVYTTRRIWKIYVKPYMTDSHPILEEERNNSDVI